ncbi:MAG: hypothetical protein KDK69_05630 [Chlamydiia bacterium]|nr:hypothetical protein [Chlamydiia bacterium]
MTQGLLVRLFICIFVLGGLLYLYIDKQNDLTELKMQIPKLTKALYRIEEENAQLCFEIERLENPERLMELLRTPEFSHLKQPLVSEVIVVHEH